MNHFTLKKLSISQPISRNDLLLQMLVQFYKNETNLNIILEIITGKSKISLRIIDWFVTNYAKKNDTYYELEKENEKRRVHIYNEYKLKLKSNGKTYFDPFCRTERICLPYKDNDVIITTIGQLNFFKWIIELDILSYVMEHYADIEKDMKTRGSISKKIIKEDILNETNLETDASTTNTNITLQNQFIKNINKTRKKREELSISASKHIKRENIEIVLEFK